MVKKKSSRFKKQIENFMFDHYIFRNVMHYVLGFLIAAIAAVIFAFGFSCFTTPANPDGFVLATGGVSGISQIISLLIEMIIGHKIGNNLVQSISYTLLNVPLLIFSYFKISKRFTIFTLINVILSSVFISIFSSTGVAETVASETLGGSIKILEPIIVRVILAGICTGISSAITFTAGFSCAALTLCHTISVRENRLKLGAMESSSTALLL